MEVKVSQGDLQIAQGSRYGTLTQQTLCQGSRWCYALQREDRGTAEETARRRVGPGIRVTVKFCLTLASQGRPESTCFAPELTGVHVKAGEGVGAAPGYV